MQQPEPLVFETIGAGQRGERLAPLFEVYRDSVSWADASSQFYPVAEFGGVDFSQSMVIALADTVRSGGYSIEVRSVDLTPDGIDVDYVLLKPADDCIPVMAEAFPFQVVKVRRADGPIRFLRNEERYRCSFR